MQYGDFLIHFEAGIYAALGKIIHLICIPFIAEEIIMYYLGLIVRLPITMTMALLVFGCASNDEVAVSNYGESVRHMIALQTSNPTGGAMGMDGQKAALTLQKYRTDVALPRDVDEKELGTTIATAQLEQQ